jgi:pSer/pThr/pTyr-binding forkhead associated (FHA) protein
MRILLMIDNTVLKEYIIDQNEIIIGRDSNSDICIDNIAVSRKHARITKGADDYLVEDMGSINGTFVNGHWVSKKLLDAGDEISIGKYSLVICLEDDPATATATATTTAKNRSIEDGYNTYRMGLKDFEEIFKKRSK